MKRSPHLHPLSWEHHAGLVVASRIERGLANGAEPAVVADYALNAWERMLKPHFELEERLLPSLLEEILGDVTILRRLFREHEEFQEPVDRIRDGEDLPRALYRFATTLRDHIRFEERELLPQLECSLSEAALQQLGKMLHEQYEPPDTGWPVKFWEKS